MCSRRIGLHSVLSRVGERMMKHVEGPPTIMDLDAELLVTRTVRHGYEQSIIGRPPHEADVEATARSAIQLMCGCRG